MQFDQLKRRAITRIGARAHVAASRKCAAAGDAGDWASKIA
jgi:hypothetical protein